MPLFTGEELPELREKEKPTTGTFVWDESKRALVFQSFQTVEKSARKKRTKPQPRGAGGLEPSLSAVERTVIHVSKTGKNESGKPGEDAAEEKVKEITLDDVKTVAISMVTKITGVSHAFEGVFHTPELDTLLYSLLHYFYWFHHYRQLIAKRNPNFIEPSTQERDEAEAALLKQEAMKKVVGQSYCSLVLGNGWEEQHHMHCGASRVSNTTMDRTFFENIYNFCTLVVWIAYKRKDYEVVREEMARILRSDTFNPALRKKHYNPQMEEAIKSGQQVAQDLTGAEYRRMHPKRPPLQNVIAQRSPVLVSILPNPTEKSPHLMDRKKPYKLKTFAKPTISKEILIDSLDESLKLGLLGDPNNLYTVQLVPKGSENSEENEDKDQFMTGQVEAPENGSQSRPKTAGSIASTGADSEDEY